MASYEKRREKLSDVHKIAMADGNADANEYMRGMANGLELAMAIIEEREVRFRATPLMTEIYNK